MIQTGDPKGDGTGGESIWKGKTLRSTLEVALNRDFALISTISVVH